MSTVYQFRENEHAPIQAFAVYRIDADGELFMLGADRASYPNDHAFNHARIATARLVAYANCTLAISDAVSSVATDDTKSPVR